MRVNVSDFVREAVEQVPDREAFVEYEGGQRRTLSWAEFAQKCNLISRALSSQGLVAGHRVALAMANSIDLAVAYFAVLQRGLVAVPMNPRSTSNEIGRMLADSRARVVLADRAGTGRIPKTDDVLIVSDDPGGHIGWSEFTADAQNTTDVAPADAEALAVLLYTSGTSGTPQGAMLSHRALIANIEQVGAIEPPLLTGDDVCLVLLPLFHIYGLNAILGQAVASRARSVFVDRFDADAVLRLVSDEQVTVLPVAPPIIAAWSGRNDVAEHLQSVRTIMSGASALEPEVETEFERTCGKTVEQGYGLTEAAPVITTTLGRGEDDPRPQSGSVGKPVPGVEIRILEQAGGQRGAADPAEIWVRGDNLFDGYWPDSDGGPGGDGWYATGDIGYIDDEGDLVIVDRLRELIIVSGFNVYPSEVEEVIEQVSGAGQVAVVGVPDTETGEAVIAYVVPASGELSESDLREAVIEQCRTKLARFKHPTQVLLVQHLPTAATGKVAKGSLRALARSEILGLE